MLKINVGHTGTLTKKKVSQVINGLLLCYEKIIYIYRDTGTLGHLCINYAHEKNVKQKIHFLKKAKNHFFFFSFFSVPVSQCP